MVFPEIATSVAKIVVSFPVVRLKNRFLTPLRAASSENGSLLAEKPTTNHQRLS